MTRAWWRRTPRIAPPEATGADLSAEQAVSDQPGRLVGPRGSVAWICATPAGRKDCAHDTEAQAEAHGAREGRVWWPITIDEGYGEAS